MKLTAHATNPRLPKFVRHAMEAAYIAKARDNSSHDSDKSKGKIQLKSNLDYGEFGLPRDCTGVVTGGSVKTEGGEIQDAFVKTEVFDPWRRTPKEVGHDASISYRIQRGEDTTTFEARRRDRTGTINYNEKVIVDDSGQILKHDFKDWSLSYPMAALSHLNAPISTIALVGLASFVGTAIGGPVGGALLGGGLFAASTHYRHKNF